MSHFHLSPRMLRGSRSRFMASSGLMKRLIVLCLPVPLLLLALVFAQTHSTVETTLNGAVARNSRILAQALGFTLSQTLHETRNQVATLAAGSTSLDEFQRRLARRLQALEQIGDHRFREAAFVGLGQQASKRFLWVSVNDAGIVMLSPQQGEAQNASPFHISGRHRGEHEVLLGSATETTYNLNSPDTKMNTQVTLQILRFTTPVVLADGSMAGHLVLGLDIGFLRDLVSSFVAGFDVDGVRPLAFFVDRQGWMIFQSGQLTEGAISTIDSVRGGFRGDFGRAGYSQAFRPSADYYGYWRMMNDIQKGQSGQFATRETSWNNNNVSVENVSYASVTYSPAGREGTEIVGGVVILDPTFAATAQGRFLRNAYLLAAGLTLLIVTLSVISVGNSLRGNLVDLDRDLRARDRDAPTEPLPWREEAPEVRSVRESVNLVLQDLRELEDERDMENALSSAHHDMEPVDDLPQAPAGEDGIVGVSKELQALREDIARAARVDADVLVMGETGTGKELVSRAIHNLSSRRDGPFVTINCGALDENLLMDSLFGHVKGAFTEARLGRKGAFLTAAGGTLMLDEIGNASPRVQQALLRALSDRRITPLGSDTAVPFDTRVVAATNADLREEIRRGTFREDLYFRLAVITVHTRPLREHKMDIPYLVAAFLKEASLGTGRPAPRLSRGALGALMHYHWPGNVRELRNAVFRTLTYTGESLILPSHLRLGSDENAPGEEARELAALSERRAKAASSRNSGGNNGGRNGARNADHPDGTPGETDGGRGQPAHPVAPEKKTDTQAPPHAGAPASSQPSRPSGASHPSHPSFPAAGDGPAGTVHGGSASAPRSSGSDDAYAGTGEGAPSSPARAADGAAGNGANGSSGAGGTNGKSAPDALVARWHKAADRLRSRGTFTRQDYQEATGVSPRTAQYDLQELLRRGIVTSTGRGRSLHYLCADREE